MSLDVVLISVVAAVVLGYALAAVKAPIHLGEPDARARGAFVLARASGSDPRAPPEGDPLEFPFGEAGGGAMEDPLAATQGLAPADRAAARKAAGNAAATMLPFFVGVLFGAAWPSAVAGCGLPVMGAVIGFLQLRRA